jgi:hypothetical protein
MAKAGWIMTALFALFMLGASVAPKFLGMAAATDAMVAIDWSPEFILAIGIVELLATLLFIVPRTGLLGAVLMTAVLGGAIASHMRAGSPWPSHTLFGVYLGLFMWLALWLRDAKVRDVLPLLRR